MLPLNYIDTVFKIFGILTKKSAQKGLAGLWLIIHFDI